MEKIPTLFMRNPENMKFVTRDVSPDAAWVLQGHGVPTIKKDGTNIRVTVQNGQCTHVEKRRNPTRAEKEQGAEPGYIDAHRDDPADKHIFAAVDATNFHNIYWPDGIHPCEALGPKIQGGVESDIPCIYAFSLHPAVALDFPRFPTYDSIRTYLEQHPAYEGIVWHDRSQSIIYARMAKIKRRDFGLPWPPKESRV